MPMTHVRIRWWMVMLGGLMLFGGFFVFQKVHAATGINKQVNFQGKVVNTDGTNVTNGSYTFLFCIYTTDSPGTACTAGANNDAIWRESKSITVTDGIFQTNLGDTTTLPGSVDFNTDNIYLGLNFNSNGQMTPLVRFTAVPYAFNADKIHGLTVTDTTGTLTIPNAKTISFADAFTTSGANALTLTTTGTTNVTLPTGGTLITNTAAANQTVTSTQTSGTVVGVTDVTNIVAAIKGQVITLSGTGAFDQTGLEFALSGASGTNLNDIVGSGSTWKVSTGGAATLASVTSPTYTSAAGLTINAGNNTLTLDSSDTALTASGVATLTLAANASLTNASGILTLQPAGSGTISRAQIGAGGGGSTTPDYLALDVKSDTGDPAGGAEGYIYYNTSDNKFRCFQGAAWTDCVSTGGATAWDTIGNPTIGADIAMAETAQTLDWNTNDVTATAFNGLTVTITNDAATDVLTQRAFVVANLNDSASTGTLETLAHIDNRDANETVGNGLLIENTGAGTLTTALAITETAGAITTGINLGNNIATGISIGTGVTTGISVGSGGITIVAGALAVNSDSITSDGTLVINASGTVDVDDILNANSITSDAGVSIAAGNTYTGAGAVTVSSGGSTALTLDATNGSVTLNTDDDLIPTLGAGDADIGATGTRWDNVFGAVGNFTSLTVNSVADPYVDETGDTMTGTLTLSLDGSENVNITNATLDSASDTFSIAQTLTGDVSSDGLSITITNNNASAVTGTNYGLNLVNADNAGNTSVIDALALFSNDQATETLVDGVIIRHNASSGTLTDALQIENTTAGGTITNAINILETAGTITTGINLGNNIATGISIGTGVTTGIAVGSGGITITAGALAVNSDSITSDGTLVINASGTVDVDDILNANSITSDAGVSIAAGQSYTGAGAVTLSSGGSSGLTLDSASGRVGVATGDFLSVIVSGVSGAAAGDIWYDSAAAKYKINEGGSTKILCNTTDLGCSAGGGGENLQTTYGLDTDTGDTTISLTTADDSLVFTNPTSSGTDSAFLLHLNQQHTTGAVSALDITQASSGANAVNLTANAIDTETGLAITANALTSGKGLSMASSATSNAFTGNLIDVTLSGSHANNTGSLLKLSNTGTANTNTTFYIDHRATGTNNLAFRVDDVSGDTDPFVIDGAGNVGIGTTAPSGALELYGTGVADEVLTITSADTTFDPLIKWRTAASPAIQFSLGVDNNDSDKFKIYSGDGLSSGDEFVIDSTGATTIATLNLGAASFDTNAGAVNWVDMPVTSSASIGTVESYVAQIDSTHMLTVYAESDGAGGIQNKAIKFFNGVGTSALIEAKALNTNFGAAMYGGAFVDNNSYYGQEFAADTYGCHYSRFSRPRWG